MKVQISPENLYLVRHLTISQSTTDQTRIRQGLDQKREMSGIAVNVKIMSLLRKSQSYTDFPKSLYSILNDSSKKGTLLIKSQRQLISHQKDWICLGTIKVTKGLFMTVMVCQIISVACHLGIIRRIAKIKKQDNGMISMIRAFPRFPDLGIQFQTQHTPFSTRKENKSNYKWVVKIDHVLKKTLHKPLKSLQHLIF